MVTKCVLGVIMNDFEIHIAIYIPCKPIKTKIELAKGCISRFATCGFESSYMYACTLLLSLYLSQFNIYYFNRTK